jgi:hypothetical protein
MLEIVVLGHQRRNANFMTAALMSNGHTLCKHLCTGQARCKNDLKNSHLLSSPGVPNILSRPCRHADKCLSAIPSLTLLWHGRRPLARLFLRKLLNASIVEFGLMRISIRYLSAFLERRHQVALFGR